MTKQDVDRHMRIHTGYVPARCDVCNKGFSSTQALEAHKLLHSGPSKINLSNLVLRLSTLIPCLCKELPNDALVHC